MSKILRQPPKVEDYRSYRYVGYSKAGKAIAGGSYSSITALCEAMGQLGPDGVAVDSYDIEGVASDGWADDIVQRVQDWTRERDAALAKRWDAACDAYGV